MKHLHRLAGAAALAALAALSLPTLAQEQMKMPQPSPASVVTQRIGVQDVTIRFSRPGVKGRKIWGDLVPYGKVWRSGANTATTITFEEDSTVDGKPIAAGTYAIFTMPSEGEWTVILNKDAKQWGAYNYKAEQDAVKVQAKPQAGPMTEWLNYSFDELKANSARVTLAWEKLAVSFTVANAKDAVQTTLGKLREKVAAAKADDFMTPTQAAQFCVDQKIYSDEAMQWAEKGLAAKKAAWPYWVKAHILEAKGKKAEAIAAFEAAEKAAGEEGDKEFQAEIRGKIAGMKKG